MLQSTYPRPRVGVSTSARVDGSLDVVGSANTIVKLPRAPMNVANEDQLECIVSFLTSDKFCDIRLL